LISKIFFGFDISQGVSVFFLSKVNSFILQFGCDIFTKLNINIYWDIPMNVFHTRKEM